MVVDDITRRRLEKAGYGIFNHFGVQLCHWTKESIFNRRFCYKHKFYGIDTWGCMQISQSVLWCTNRCIYCWRPTEYFQNYKPLPKDQVDPPNITLEKLKELRKKLLLRFKDSPKVDKEMLEKALEPTHVTFSLSGEPLLYPFVPESIEYIKKNWNVKSIFVVTNGVIYEEIQRMIEENKLPTQLYISLNAPEEELYKKIVVPLYPDAWERINKSLRIGSKARIRRAIRITLIKGINDRKDLFEHWAKLIEKYNPHFVEIKAYMYLGRSKERLSKENSPRHEEIVSWTKELSEYLPNYEYWNEDQPSRVAVLKNRKDDIDPIIQ